MTILITGVLHDKKELVTALTRMTITMKNRSPYSYALKPRRNIANLV
ncbi:hypothetical protein M942_13330 [Enterobacter ludwigii]|nr:hypothetical protein M942_13330 [Enterobacter ludwigii]